VSDRPASASYAFAAAINAGDVAGALACWAPEAVIVAPDGTETRGAEALEARFRQLVDGGVRLDIHVADAIETARAATARSRMAMTPASGETLTLQATVVYVRTDDGWRIAVDRIDAAA
jgi:ketosteroid isomerase-like protein